MGGTPAYRREFTQDDTPTGPDDFDAWVIRAVLNPARPLFREAHYLLAEDPGLRDTALYHSVLAAIADGNATRGGIAGYLARKSTDLAHPLSVLEDVGMITHETDAFRRNRSAYRITEPLVTFHHALERPHWGELERPGRAALVWQRVQATFRSKVVGPRFEQICRDWARWYAGESTLGGYASRVGSGTVADPAAQTGHELDVAMFGRDNTERETLLAIGEAKWRETMGVAHLRRLARVAELLRARDRTHTGLVRLLCFSGTGFTDELRHLAADDDTVELVDLARLYQGA